MITIEDLRNPKRNSGFERVAFGEGGSKLNPYFATVNLKSGTPQAFWHGKRRRTAEEAAQDYCDYVNSGKSPQQPVKPVKAPKPLPRMLQSAGHKRPKSVSTVQVSQRTKRPKPDTDRQGFVYLVGEHGNDDEVKIGWSARPGFSRLAELQTGNPRVLLGLGEIPGTQQDEYQLHVRYEPDNVLQEWFTVSDELLMEFDLDPYQFEVAVHSHGRKMVTA